MNELHWIGSGSSGTRVLGLVPRVSVDIRIRCPRTFTDEFPPPPPPSIAHSELASKAAQKIMSALWFCRWYVEVIKVGYTLDDCSPDTLYITGEIILVEPTGEKFNIKQTEEIGYKWGRNGMTLELMGPEKGYEDILRSLARGLMIKTREAVLSRKNDIDRHSEKLRRFLAEFSTPLDAVL